MEVKSRRVVTEGWGVSGRKMRGKINERKKEGCKEDGGGEKAS